MQLNQFWQEQLALIEEIDPGEAKKNALDKVKKEANMLINTLSITSETTDFKTHELPLARIKKIMKQEDEVGACGDPWV